MHAPDNSYEAFEAAVSEDLPWIELDVQLTADNIVVAEHDQTLQRRFGINKAVCNMTYKEILQYTVTGISDSRYKDVRITTLEDVLLLAKKTICWCRSRQNLQAGRKVLKKRCSGSLKRQECMTKS